MGNRKCGRSPICRQGHRGLVPALRRGRGTEHNADRQDKIKRGGNISMDKNKIKRLCKISEVIGYFVIVGVFFACFLVKEIL